MITLYNEKNIIIDEISTFEYTMQNSGMGDELITFKYKSPSNEMVDFNLGWYVIYNNKKFMLKTYSPPAEKNNSSLFYSYTLTFSTKLEELKHKYMFNFVSENDFGRKVNDYNFSFNGDIKQFVERIRYNLIYHFGGSWDIVLSDDVSYSDEPVMVSVQSATIWDVITQLWDLYALRFRISYGDVNTIIVGEKAQEVEAIFEYGVDKGLYKVERVVNNEDIVTRLRGKGGSRNIPLRYFKDEVTFDDTLWVGDPDKAEELSTTYYKNLMPSLYRQYVKGWNQAKSGGQLPPDVSFAYRKGYGDYTSGNYINPIDYVESEKIDKWGVRDGTIDDNEEIYPTIQNTELNGVRIDTVIDVEKVISDEWMDIQKEPYTIPNIETSTLHIYKYEGTKSTNIQSDTFRISELSDLSMTLGLNYRLGGLTDTFSVNGSCRMYRSDGILYHNFPVFNIRTENRIITLENIPAGNYYFVLSLTISIQSLSTVSEIKERAILSDIKFQPKSEYKETFDVWIPDVGFDLRDTKYWTNEDMKFMFSDGELAGEDYEFRVIGEVDDNGKVIKPYIYEDTSKTYNGITSKYRITLEKSNAEVDASGLYLPNININAKPGDHFFIINIQLPHTYVELAEEKLTRALYEELSLIDDEYPTFAMYISKIFYNDFNEKDKIEIGNAKLRLRDSSLIDGAYEILHIQNLTQRYTENSILPETIITISDKVMPYKNSLQIIRGEIKSLSYSSRYGYYSDEGDTMYLRKDGIADTSYSQTTFKQPISMPSWRTEDFRQAQFGGSGAGLYRDENNNSCLEIDKLFVRRELHVNELVINQISSIGGKVIISPANMKVDSVLDTGSSYRLSFDTEGGRIDNLWKIGDQAYCQRFNANNTGIIKYYWALVTAVGEDYIHIDKIDKDGDGVPEVGDNIAAIGSRTDKSRQAAFIIDTLNGGDIVLYGEINSYDFTNKNFVGYGVRPQTGEPYFYTYGDAFFGDRNLESNYITFQKRQGDTERKLYIDAVVNFGQGSTGLSNLSEWNDALGDFNQSIDELDKINKETQEKLNMWADDNYISPLEKEPLWNAWLGINTQFQDFIRKIDIYASSEFDRFFTLHVKAYAAVKKYTAVTPENILVEDDYLDMERLVYAMNDYYETLEEIIKENAGNKNYDGVRPTDPKIGDTFYDGQVTELYTSTGWVPVSDDTQTTIDNGMISTGTLAVGQGNTHTQGLAGMTGAGNKDESIRIWAGDTDRENAPFRVNQAGEMYASKATIEGTIHAIDGTFSGVINSSRGSIAGFTLSEGLIGVQVDDEDPNDGLSLTNRLIKFVNTNKKQQVTIGASVYDNAQELGTFYNGYNNPNSTNYGINIVSHNAKYNLAMYGLGNVVFDGLVSSNSVSNIDIYSTNTNRLTLSNGNVFIINARDSAANIYLPIKEEVYAQLGLSEYNRFSVRLTIICDIASSYGFYIYGRGTSDSDLNHDGNAYIIDSGNTVERTRLTSGNVIEMQLTGTTNSYYAYKIN